MRDSRRRQHSNKNLINDKIILYSLIGVAGVILIVTGVLIFGKNSNNDNKYGKANKITGGITNTTSENTESASSQIGKSVNEAEQNITNSINTSSENTTNSTNILNGSNTLNTTNSTLNSNKNTTITKNQQSKNTVKETNASNDKAKDSEAKLSFIKPVEGEILTEFSKDQLIYSKTLNEWTTHQGIDIKAEKTTVVKSAEAGTVKSIKNDPRYGLTIVVDHGQGLETVYSNLLTSEFVVEGEKVEKGQTIGTLGNTAAFEIADESHLHFEIWKNSEAVNPNDYLS